jgi:glycosyltransferase involved in cell wall biosynthesis
MRRSLEWRRRIGNSDHTIILYVGRLSHEKNLMALAAAYMAVESPTTHLVVVGDGPARADLERALSGHNVTYTGYLSGEALAEAYASSDIFAFPSTTETFGQVVLEAMASQLPVVAFDAEGIRDQIRHGETGFLAPVGDCKAFTQALGMLVDAPELRQCLGHVAQSLAAGRSWDSALSGLLDIYYEVTGHLLTERAA